jgi:serine phosphatase RsbU (regulator of sigma subunit)
VASPIARDLRRRVSGARSVKRLAAASLSCCALGLAFIPAATAKRDHEGSGASTSTAQAGTQTAPASGPPTTTSSTSTEAAAPQAKRHAASERAHQAPAAATAPSADAGQGAAPATPQAGHPGARRDSHEQAAQRKPHGGRSRGTGEAGAVPAAGELEGEQDEAQPEAQILAARTSGKSGKGSKGKSGKGHGKGGKGEGSPHESGKGSKGKSKKEPEPEKAPEETKRAPSPSPVLTSASPASALTPTAIVAAAATPVAPAPAPASGVSTPVRIVHHGHVPRRTPRGGRHARAGAPAAAVAPAVGALGALGTAPHVAAVHHARRKPGGSPGASGGPVAPLVKTITKIVEVVPTAMRVLIAALLALALALAMRSRVAAARARRLERQRGELLDDVGLLQAALLPVTPVRFGPVGASTAYQPAAGPGAGGDFYDVFALADGQLAVIVGDISGHGRQALPHTALVRFTLRAYLEAGLSPRDALQTAGAVLERQLGGVFATVVVATYQPSERVLVYACAGHPQPLVLGARPGAGSLASVTISTSPPIGVGMRTGTRQTTVSLPGRAQVCFYTDGVTEARVGSDLFGAERLTNVLEELGAEATAAAVLECVAEHVDARPDDMAACVLSMEGEEREPKVLVEELEVDRSEASSTRTASFLRACGVADGEVAEVIRSACAATGRAGAVVLEVRTGEHTPTVTLRRDQLAYLHARRPQAAQGGEAEVAR